MLCNCFAYDLTLHTLLNNRGRAVLNYGEDYEYRTGESMEMPTLYYGATNP